MIIYADNHFISMHLTKRVSEWGNVYGVPISKKEAEALGVRPGDEVDLEVRAHAKSLDLSDLPKIPLGSHQVNLDQLIEEETTRDTKAGS